MKRFIIFVSVSAMVLMATSVMAQDDSSNTVIYGQTVTGEITNREFEIEYVFNGTTGDVVIIEMEQVDPLGDLSFPMLVVLDTEYSILWNTGSYGDATLAAVLPYDGEYTILATRSDGRAGDSVGEYTLTLSNPPMLQVGVPVQGEISSEEVVYYAIDMTIGQFTVAYEKLQGEFFPDVTLNAIDDGELDDVASLTGQLMSGSLGIDPAYASGDVLLVSLHEALWDWNFSEVKATYTLTLEQ